MESFAQAKDTVIKVKRALILFLAFSVFMSSLLPVSALENIDKTRVSDNANLLNSSERQSLEELLYEISRKHGTDIVVATSYDTVGMSVYEYADMIYDEGDYGSGDFDGGVMLFVSLAERDYYIDAEGNAIPAFTDDGIRYIGLKITDYLADGEYGSAFESFAYMCDDFLSHAESGAPYDSSNLPREKLSLVWIPISLGIGILIATVILCVTVGKLKTVRPKNSAENYIKENGMTLDESRDIFLYTTVTKKARPQNDGADSGRSTTRVSPSGRVHRGGGGKF